MESASDKEAHAEIVISLSAPEDLSTIILTVYTRDMSDEYIIVNDVYAAQGHPFT